MHPILVSLNGFPIHTYGILLAMGFVLGVLYATRQAESLGLEVETITNILLLVLACAILGARSVFVAVNWPHFAAHPIEILHLHRGGLVFYGGLLGGALAGVLGARWHGISVPVFADIVPAGLCIGQLLGRLGCYFNGCCFGAVCGLPWAIRMTHGPGAGVPRHPTQLYEVILVAAIGWLSTRYFLRPHRPGMVMVFYLYAYGAGRYAIEVCRGDDRGGEILFGLSVSQCISLGILLTAVLCHLWIDNTPRPSESEAPPPATV